MLLNVSGSDDINLNWYKRESISTIKSEEKGGEGKEEKGKERVPEERERNHHWIIYPEDIIVYPAL